MAAVLFSSLVFSVCTPQKETPENDNSDSGNTDVPNECPSDLVSEGAGEDFTIIVLPDTQNYTKWRNDIFEAQMDWIVANKTKMNIVIVLHEGDIVQSYDADMDEWDFVDQMMGQIEMAEIPFVLVPGNHDYAQGSRDSTLFNEYFPLSRFKAMSTYGGAFDDEKSDNTYHLLSAGGLDFVILGLEFGPRDDVLAWARNIAAEYIDRTAVVLTHAYLLEDGTLLEQNTPHSPTNGYGLSTDSNNGVDIWDKLIEPMGNMTFVFSGHVGIETDGAAYLNSEGACGNSVHQMMANYQYCPWEDSGYLRILKFSPRSKTLSVETYSPVDDIYKADGENAFEITSLPFW